MLLRSWTGSRYAIPEVSTGASGSGSCGENQLARSKHSTVAFTGDSSRTDRNKRCLHQMPHGSFSFPSPGWQGGWPDDGHDWTTPLNGELGLFMKKATSSSRPSPVNGRLGSFLKSEKREPSGCHSGRRWSVWGPKVSGELGLFVKKCAGAEDYLKNTWARVTPRPPRTLDFTMIYAARSGSRASADSSWLRSAASWHWMQRGVHGTAFSR